LSNSQTTGRTLGRVAALIAGLTILVIAGVTTLGIVLFAPFGFWIAHRIQRRRGRRLDAWGSWIGAASGVIAALLIVAGIVAVKVPPGSWEQIRKVTDSASVQAAKQPPPAWLTRIAPAQNRSALSAASGSTTFNGAMMVWGISMAIGMFGAAIGTIGWAGAMLLVFYATGRWVRERPPEVDLLVD
jgi:hypothetical protein